MWRKLAAKERVKENDMRKNYHLCLSGGNEIIFRDLEDYNRGFNIFALALHKTNTTGLAESFMSTHCHLIVQSDDPDLFIHSFRNAYSKYFNRKYHRNGRLGESIHFSMEVTGYHHLIAAIRYTLRNALHHGVVPIPYAYPYCSANAFFRKEMGKFTTEPVLASNASYLKYIGRNYDYPSSYKMSASGVFLRESVLDVPQVENLFVTPRAFNYYMTRKSSEEWEAEQNKDKSPTSPINISKIESGITINRLDEMIYYEAGKADYRKSSDLALCTEINAIVKEHYYKDSVYQLTIKEQREIAEYLYKSGHHNTIQIQRCLAMLK